MLNKLVLGACHSLANARSETRRNGLIDCTGGNEWGVTPSAQLYQTYRSAQGFRKNGTAYMSDQLVGLHVQASLLATGCALQ